MLCSMVLPAGASTIVLDGNFETANATNNTYGPGQIGDGWSVANGTIAILNNSQGFGTAYTGQQFADLDFGSTSNTLSQSLASIPGTIYVVSFWLSDDVGGNPLSVVFGSTTLVNMVTPALGSGNYA